MSTRSASVPVSLINVIMSLPPDASGSAGFWRSPRARSYVHIPIRVWRRHYDEAVAHRRWLLLVVLAFLTFELVWSLIWQLDRQLLFVLFVP
jgi:hypothetical protein